MTKPKRSRRSQPHTANIAVRAGSSQWKILSSLVEALAPQLEPDLLQVLRPIIRTQSMSSYLDLSSSYGLQSIGRSEAPTSHIAAQLLVVSVLRKYSEGTQPSEHIADAFKKVKENELACQAFVKRRHRIDMDSATLQRVKHLIHSILGKCPETISSHIDCRHGPGSSTTHSKRRQSSYFKYEEWPYTCSTRAKPHLVKLIACDQRWISYLEESYRERYDLRPWQIINWPTFYDTIIVTCDDNKITTVPKDATKVRPIAIEPTGNIMLQLGVDAVMRKRLKRWGLDLNDQTRNREMARRGSVEAPHIRPATIDLASASDLVSTAVVKMLLPKDWYNYLLDIRSPFGVFPSGERIRYRKISSMGNGYTFTLESLIFFACAKACTERSFGNDTRHLISTFGDDIIVPEMSAVRTINLLETLGFSVNTEKSFISGTTKESCGADYVRGCNVRPVYLRAPVNKLTDVFSIRNRLNRWFILHQGFMPKVLDKLFESWIGHKTKHIGPISDDEFDTYWHVDRPTFGAYKHSSFHYTSLSQRSVEIRGKTKLRCRNLMHNLKPQRPKMFYQTTSSGSRFKIASDVNTKYKVTRRSTPQWCDQYSPSA